MKTIDLITMKPFNPERFVNKLDMENIDDVFDLLLEAVDGKGQLPLRALMLLRTAWARFAHDRMEKFVALREKRDSIHQQLRGDPISAEAIALHRVGINQHASMSEAEQIDIEEATVKADLEEDITRDPQYRINAGLPPLAGQAEVQPVVDQYGVGTARTGPTKGVEPEERQWGPAPKKGPATQKDHTSLIPQRDDVEPYNNFLIKGGK